MQRPIQRVLVGCRGDVGARIVHAIEALGIEAVAAYDDAEPEAPHIDAAAYAVHVSGVDPWRDPMSLVSAAMDSGADAIHPGIVGLARSGEFARIVQNVGLAWIGPRAEHLEDFADRGIARARARDAGLEVIPSSPSLEDADEVVAWIERFGAPVVLRPSRRGGGPAMRFESTAAAIARVRLGLGAAIVVERGIADARHVVFVVVGDGEGNAVHVGEHERSVGDGFGVLLRECPSPGVDAARRNAVGCAAADFVAAFDYLGVGGVEFLVGTDGLAWFIDFDPGLPEGFGLHDAVYGVDLVQAQVALAGGEDLGWSQEDIEPGKYAVELLVCATGPGVIERISFGEGADVSTRCAVGMAVEPALDPVIARVRVTGPSRHSALVRAKAVVERADIEGLPTNLPRLASLLGRREVWDGATRVGLIDLP